MTVTTINSRISYVGDGSSVAFPFPYYFLASTDIEVFLNFVEQGGGFSVSGAGSPQGGTVTFTTAPAPGVQILLARVPDLLQGTDLPPNDPFPSDAVEKGLDKLTMIAQELSENQGRAVHFPLSEAVDGELPLAGQRASKVYAFDVNGNPTLVPMPSSLGAGDLRWENGNDGTRGFKTGVDFTPNVTAQLTLSRSPINEANVWAYWDGVEQTDFTISSGNKLNFPTAIPSGISVVNVRVGTTLSLNIPAQGSVGTNELANGAVTDAKVAANSALYDRIAIVVMVTDPAYGAKGDGVTDDTAAIQAALNSGKYVVFPAGFTFYSATGVTVPVTCPGINGTGATIKGPGSGSSVDGITFNGWYQGGGDQLSNQRGQSYFLPNVQGFRHGIAEINAAWVMARCDLVKQCSSGHYLQVDTGKYVVECDISIRQITQCDKGFHEKIAGNTGGDTEGVQGCRFECFYLSACNKGLYRDIAATSVSTYNEYYFVELDANGCSGGTSNAYAIYNNAQSSAFIANKYRIPLGPINCNASPSPFSRCEDNSDYDILGFRGSSVSAFAWSGFLPGGFVPVGRPANGVMNVFVDVTNGNDSTGDGSAAAPYNTITAALAKIQNIDLRGNSAIINLAPGTYPIGLNLNTDQGPYSNAHIYLRGSGGNASLVNVTGGIVASGAGSRLTVEFLSISTSGLQASNNAYVDFDNVIFGGAASSSHLFAQHGGRIVAAGPYTISGGGISHVSAQYGGRISLDGVSVTVSGTPNFSTAFAYCAAFGFISSINTTFSGSATGTRYSSILNAVINTNGGGANYFPGNAAGSAGTGGQYA